MIWASSAVSLLTLQSLFIRTPNFSPAPQLFFLCSLTVDTQVQSGERDRGNRVALTDPNTGGARRQAATDSGLEFHLIKSWNKVLVRLPSARDVSHVTERNEGALLPGAMGRNGSV